MISSTAEGIVNIPSFIVIIIAAIISIIYFICGKNNRATIRFGGRGENRTYKGGDIKNIINLIMTFSFNDFYIDITHMQENIGKIIDKISKIDKVFPLAWGDLITMQNDNKDWPIQLKPIYRNDKIPLDLHKVFNLRNDISIEEADISKFKGKTYLLHSIIYPTKFFTISEKNVEFGRGVNDAYFISKKSIKFLSTYESILSAAVKEFNTHFKKEITSKESVVQVVKFMVDSAMRWCVEHDVEIETWYKQNYITIENLYNTPSEQNNKGVIKSNTDHLFPQLEGVDKDGLMYTAESIYSTTPPGESAQINEMIISSLPQNERAAVSIIDGTANIGGNSLSFARDFQRLLAVEVDDENYKALKNNIDVVYKSKITADVSFRHASIVDVLAGVKPGEFNSLFLDPPWGGIQYRYYKRLRLYLDGIDVSDLIIEHMKKFKVIALKAPSNFDIDSLAAKLKESRWSYERHTIRNYLIIVMFPAANSN